MNGMPCIQLIKSSVCCMDIWKTNWISLKSPFMLLPMLLCSRGGVHYLKVNALFSQTRTSWINRILRRLLRLRAYCFFCTLAAVDVMYMCTKVNQLSPRLHDAFRILLLLHILIRFVWVILLVHALAIYLSKWKSFCCYRDCCYWAWNFLLFCTHTHTSIIKIVR